MGSSSPRRGKQPSRSASATAPGPRIDDAAIGASFRNWLDYLLDGSYDDYADIYEYIADSERSDFPWQPAVEALAELNDRVLWRAFSDDQLQDLYDWAHEAGLEDAAERFAHACRVRPDSGKIPDAVRRAVMARDGERCRRCGSTTDLTIDHKIIAWIDGGSSADPDNLQVLCRSCNSSKGAQPWALDPPAPPASSNSRSRDR
jgi:hypothetical protein